MKKDSTKPIRVVLADDHPIVRAGIREGDPVAALAAVATKLHDADRALVYLAADLSCETHRAAIAVADLLGAALDSVTSTTAAPGVLAAQRRGRTTATLGEIRNRADAVLFWGTDPATRYPRFTTRYVPDPEGLFVPAGRRGRTVIAADIAADHGPADADTRVAFAADEEVAALSLVRAGLRRRAGGRARRPASRIRVRRDRRRRRVRSASRSPTG